MTFQEKTLRGRVLPTEIPLFPLSGVLLLPCGLLPLNIFEPRYLRMVDDALGSGRLIGMVQPRENDRREGGGPPLYDIGCAGRIVSFVETGDGRYQIALAGRRRFRIIKEISSDAPYRSAEVRWLACPADRDEDPTAAEVDRERLLKAMRAYLDAQGLKTDWSAAEEAPTEALVVSLAMGCPFAPSEKQALLEAETVSARAEFLIALMEMESASDDEGSDAMQ